MDERAVTRDTAASQYVLTVDGDAVGHVQYEQRSGAVALVHTEVDQDRQEKGLGSALVQGVLEDLRARGSRIIPECPFVREWLTRHPEFADLVAAGD